MKNRRIVLGVLFFMGSCFTDVFSQEFTDLYGDYLGQTPPGDIPEVFAPGVISRSSLEHSGAIFSSDGNEVFWCWRQNLDSTLHVFFMRRIDNRWTKPEEFQPFGDSVERKDPHLTFDGKRLYFTAKTDGKGDIWYVDRQEDSSWGKPHSVSSRINNENEWQWQAALTGGGDMYYSSTEFGPNGTIVRSTCNSGEYDIPEPLPGPINTGEYDGDPWIAADDSYMLFSSRRPHGKGESSLSSQDIYLSVHNIAEDTWSKPVNLGHPVNTDAVDRWPTISPEGKYLFFSRYVGNGKSMDVFWVSTSVVDRIRETINAE